MAFSLSRSNKPWLSIRQNVELLLSFVSFVFKNAVVGDFRYIVCSAQLLIGNLSGLQTNLAAGGDPSRGGGALCRTSSVLVYYPRDGTA